jgi:hypothetical protein
MIYYHECVCFFSVLFSRSRCVCVRGKLADEPAENVIEGKDLLLHLVGRSAHKYSERGEFAKVANENFFLIASCAQ